MLRRLIAIAVLLTVAASSPLLAPEAHAGLKLDRWKGHVAFGYAKLVSDSLAPAGSLSTAAGIAYPVRERWLVGPTLSFNLLGSSSAKRGSVTAGVDYSEVDVALMATYLPQHTWFSRVALGPGIASAHADLAVAAGGAAFRDLAVFQSSPEFAIEATLMPRRMKIVAIGAELGARILPTDQGAWTILTARMAIHF